MTEPVSSASVTIEGICAAVRAWLEDRLDDQEQRPPPGPI
jgi:hypothetical protein